MDLAIWASWKFLGGDSWYFWSLVQALLQLIIQLEAYYKEP